ncbi:MAG: SAM-dependent methyltransferase [Muribaculaceae bacterium]|nr:SAM-dependent methyltransferase [Muribaculaceae bacterium]
MKIQSALYLVPVPISGAPVSDVIPAGNLEILGQLRHFIVENVRTARRYLRHVDPAFPIADCTFSVLDRHTGPEEVSAMLDPLRSGEPVGVMSEAGCPAVADPGSHPVEIAQREGLKVVPLVGPSSILMSLMASGFNGQGFSFQGYLPIDGAERRKALKRLESESSSRQMTQIFIETPYRNNRMVALLAESLAPSTMVCVACDITDSEKEEVVTLRAAEWKKRKYDYDKRPAIFLLYAGAKGGDRRRYEKK